MSTYAPILFSWLDVFYYINLLSFLLTIPLWMDIWIVSDYSVVVCSLKHIFLYIFMTIFL